MTQKVSKFGSNPEVKTIEEDVWDGGGIYQYLTSAEKLKVSSDDNEDKASGSGANRIQLFGCGGNYIEQNEIIELDGINPVETKLSYLRIWRQINRSAGNRNNIGNILAKNQAENKVLAQISIGKNQTLMALWTVPADQEFRMVSWYGSCGAGKETHFFLYVRPFGEVFQLKKPVTIKHGFFSQPTPLEEFLAPMTDITIRASSDLPGGMVSAGFDGFYNLRR